VNCGFETGDFTGWTQSGNTGFTSVTGSFGGIAPNSGNFPACMGPVGSDGLLSQTFGTLSRRPAPLTRSLSMKPTSVAHPETQRRLQRKHALIDEPGADTALYALHLLRSSRREFDADV